MTAAHHSALPASALAKASNYTLTLWPKLTRFLQYPELELSNNLAENSMRPVALGRKNWIHIGSHKPDRKSPPSSPSSKAAAGSKSPCAITWPLSSPDSLIARSGAFQILLLLPGRANVCSYTRVRSRKHSESAAMYAVELP